LLLELSVADVLS